LIRCIFYYASLVLIINAKIQARKGLILFNIANEIITLNKHVYVDYFMITKIFKEKVNNLLKEPYEEKPTKKRPHVNGNIISNFFATKDSYKKDDA
jgi:hypothetical protein